jgi:hypothetical protein
MIMRNALTGGLEVYDIDHNQITGAAFLGMERLLLHEFVEWMQAR